jgi:zinc and cadmium transporter
MYFELFISLLVISLASLIGVFTLSINHKKLEHFLEAMVAFAIGALLGDVFIHLLPELSENGLPLDVSLTILVGMLAFFILEKFIHWHHCHHVEHSNVCETPSFGYVALAGDAMHNFIDGLILAGAFIANPAVGVATAIAILLHEVPQEIADFGVLLKSGFTQKKALLYNFLISLTAFLGAGVALAMSSTAQMTPYLIAFTIGGFLYLAGTDLLPQLHIRFSKKDALIQFICIVIGVAIMFAMLSLE